MIKVFATGINDLTVARYFAAMNVDLLGFNISKENKKEIKEIIDWVEGPKVVLEVEDADFLDEATIDVNAHFIYLVEEEEWHPGKLYNGEKYPSFMQIEDGSVLDRLRLSNETDNYFSVDVVDRNLLDKLKAIDCGLMLISGNEEIPGIKSFDEMDEIFDLIAEV
jgi:hypothetical protein